MKYTRGRGILMHISTLNGDFGCGSFGDEAREFVDLLVECGYGYWQTLPFGVPDVGGSPYKSFSAFAGNPLFIDLPTLCREGILTEEELESERALYCEGDSRYKCDFVSLTETRYALLRRAARRVMSQMPALAASIEDYAVAHPQLDGFCRYMSEVREARLGGGADGDGAEELFFYRFTQYEFFTQWLKLKEYANLRGVSIIGDIPIYVDLDSADVWQYPQYFNLDSDGRPLTVAGVPPDYFAPFGQKWGNPVYKWDVLKADGYGWWLDRIRWQLEIFDGLRIDHFRGFSAYYDIPIDEEYAVWGSWHDGPGLDFIEKVKEVAGERLIIAEDLGVYDYKTRDLLEASGFPGMRVFQFAFTEPDSPHLPHNYIENCVAYSGTHDNTTLLAFTLELDEQTRRRMLEYIGFDGDGAASGDAVLRTLSRSAARLTVFPIQDILGFGCDTRMNVPGVAEGNWSYRVTGEQLTSIDRAYRLHVGKTYGRA